MKSSQRSKSAKATAAGAVLLAVMLAASACGNNNSINNDSLNNGSNITNNIPQTDNMPEQSGISDSGVASPDGDDSNVTGPEGSDGPADDNASNENEAPVIQGEGVYVGAMDSNSIEITMNNSAEAFQLPPGLAQVIREIPANANVKFEYTEKILDSASNLKQLWLVSIELAD